MSDAGAHAGVAAMRLVVVGGTSGIGLSAARALLASGAAGVVVTGRDPGKVGVAVESLGACARGLAGDASEPGHAEAAIDCALRELGGFDGLYHVAGGSGRRMGDGPLHELTDEGWDGTFRLNLNSLFRSNRAAVRQFIKQGTGGSILNLGSILGTSPSPAFFATHAYASCKSAVIGFTRSCASYYAGKGIRFNLLVPALVETPMSQRAMGDARILEFIRTKQPLEGGRVGQPSDLDAAAVYFLGRGSAFVTGQVLNVDGGWSVSEGQLPD